MTNARTWVLLTLLTGSGPVLGQPPDAGTYSAVEFKVNASRGQLVKMRDGVRLSVDVYRPDAPGRFPGILMHTPYSNNSAGLVQRARWFARRGYAVTMSDVRGRYDSEGEWDPFDR